MPRHDGYGCSSRDCCSCEHNLRRLNAMHEAEQVLHDRGLFEKYIDVLNSILHGHARTIVKIAECGGEET